MKFKTNNFFKLADDYSENLTEEEEIKVIDRTALFFTELEKMIDDKELINIAINGQVRKGKSTIAIQIGKYIMDILIRKGKNKNEFSIKNIARDQQEFSKMMRDQALMNTVVVIDEFNELETSGENVTIEEKLLAHFSDVQASRYVHKVLCSPKENYDKNSEIFLEVIQSDKEKMVTHCRLYYNLFKRGLEQRMLIGYVNVPVGDLIKTWVEKVEPIFLRGKMMEINKEEGYEKVQRKVLEYRKKDFYVDYMVRKHEKMQMINKEGIYQLRKLDYSEVIYEIVEETKRLVELNIINMDIIRSYVKKKTSEKKIPTTILGVELISKDIKGYIDMWKAYYRIVRELEKNDANLKKGKIDLPLYTYKKKNLNESMNDISNTISMMKEELERMMNIKKKYEKVESLNG